MSTAVITGRIAEASPSFKARMAGVLYLLSLGTAVGGESFARGSLAIAVGLIAVAGMIAVTLLVYDILRPVNESLAWFAASFSLAGLTLEALRWNPQGIDIAMVLHGLYCALMGYLVFRSAWLPRFLGALMLVGGLGWLTFLSPPLANSLSPYNTAAGLIGEGSVMLWILLAGVNVESWKSQARVAGFVAD
jgi:Domain of unknown function (DUF4386)